MRTTSEISVRTGPGLRQALDVLHEAASRDGEEGRARLHSALRHLLQLCRAAAISADQVRAAVVEHPDSILRTTLPVELRDELRTVAALLRVSESDLFRAAVMLEPSHRHRLRLEHRYRKVAQADPSRLSDAYLELWHKQQHGTAPVGTDLVLRVTEPIYARLDALEDRAGAQSPPVGVPTPEMIRKCGMQGLRVLDELYEIHLPADVRLPAARRQVMKHFGYTNTRK